MEKKKNLSVLMIAVLLLTISLGKLSLVSVLAYDDRQYTKDFIRGVDVSALKMLEDLGYKEKTN